MVDPEKRQAATARLRELAAADTLTSRHVRLAAAGCGVSERTVWRWIGPQAPATDGRARPGYRLTDTDRAAYAFYRANAAAVHRARSAAVEGTDPPGGTSVPAEQGPLSAAQALALFHIAVGEPVAEGDPGLLALQADGLVTTPDRAGVCADLALALDPGEPEEPTRSNQGSGWTKDTAGY